VPVFNGACFTEQTISYGGDRITIAGSPLLLYGNQATHTVAGLTWIMACRGGEAELYIAFTGYWKGTCSYTIDIGGTMYLDDITFRATTSDTLGPAGFTLKATLRVPLRPPL
jgi:hypothetical protein